MFVVRFDTYFCENMISFKQDCDNLPEFDVDFRNYFVEQLVESKPHKEANGETSKCVYYPGITLRLVLPRNPS